MNEPIYPVGELKFNLLPQELEEDAKINCTKCDTVSFHQMMEFMPMPTVPDVDIPFEMKRRLLMCRNCGNMSLKK